MTKSYGVIVIGAGHAGVEAAAAAARLGVRTALVTMDRADLGQLSCNPAVGGLGKGHIVRELDALGGVMPRLADVAGISFRLLNRRKGPAVRGPRAQVDRALYRQASSRWLGETSIDLLIGEVRDLRIHQNRVTGLCFADGTIVDAERVILATGTFLGATLHIGDDVRRGGRAGGQAATALATQLRGLGLATSRLKTGTPPRLDGRTIDWSALEMQAPDPEPSFFSALTQAPAAPQICCGISRGFSTLIALGAYR
ncbi:MAG: FAD-dependent oxidoreductase [Pseudomonadota bacterium]